MALLPTRLNDPKTGIFIVMMQRSHERDLIGHILAKEFNGTHVCLPAEFEPHHPYVFVNPKFPVPRRTDSSNGTDGGPKLQEPWYDFREEGEPLWHGRFSKEVLRDWATRLTSHAAAGQLQQRPTAREGGLFKRHWFANPVKSISRDHLTLVRAWDLASASDQSGDPDYASCLLNRGAQRLVGREIPGVFDLLAYRVMRERCCSTYFFNFKALGCTNSRAQNKAI